MKTTTFPPMGWNSWDCYGAGINEEQFLNNAGYMAEHLLKSGYEYAVIDIEWSEPTADSTAYHHFKPLYMDEYSRLIPAPERFPSSAGGRGFAPIAEKVHAMGLKFGVHIMRGIPRQAVYSGAKTITGIPAADIADWNAVCPWNSEMYGVKNNEQGQAYYDSLLSLYASWGVDFIKCDDICVTEGSVHDPYSGKYELGMLRSAIDRCGREIVLSVSPGPARLRDAAHLSLCADMWRLTGDFWDEWDKLRAMFDVTEKWFPWTSRGWPDCDMLPVGMLCVNNPSEVHRSRFTPDELKTMLALWCVFRSPLILGGDLPSLNEPELAVITDPLLLDLDRSGTERFPLTPGETVRSWLARTSDGKTCLFLFNLSDSAQSENIEISSNLKKYFGDNGYKEYVIGEGRTVEVPSGTLKLAPHATKVLIKY